MTQRILVCGSRDWTNINSIRKVLTKIKYSKTKNETKDDAKDETKDDAKDETKDDAKVITIIHGGCSGADVLAGNVAFSLGMKIEVYKADWKRYGRGAGPIRNQLMLDRGQPDLIIAFHSCLESSKGTKDMVNRGRKAGVTVKVYKN